MRRLRWVKTRPRLSRGDLLFTLLPIILWAVLHTLVQPAVTQLGCRHTPAECRAEEVIWPDRLAIGFSSEKANEVSNFTQNSAGALAFVLPAALQLSRLALGSTSPWVGLSAIATDFVLLFQATFWNGALNSAVRVIVQRPRPFVYRNPQVEGESPVNYTSFYSGHTSFAALAATLLLLIMVSRQAPRWLIFSLGFHGAVNVFLTAIMRVLAGKHFFTDVFFGALAGVCVAIWVFRRNVKQA